MQKDKVYSQASVIPAQAGMTLLTKDHIMLLTLILCCFVSYLLGSIPFGLILSKWAGLGDVRTVGSGNIGATNVLRLGDKKIAAMTLGLDILKGLVAVIIAVQIITQLMPFMGDVTEAEQCATRATFNLIYDACGYSAGQMEYILFLAGMSAVLGHMHPVWLGYKGGKGVATFFGVMLGFNWIAGLLAMAIWIVVALVSRRSSLAALIATALSPLFLALASGEQILQAYFNENQVYAFESIWPLLGCTALVILIWYKHLENIARLRAGTEPKIDLPLSIRS